MDMAPCVEHVQGVFICGMCTGCLLRRVSGLHPAQKRPGWNHTHCLLCCVPQDKSAVEAFDRMEMAEVFDHAKRDATNMVNMAVLKKLLLYEPVMAVS